MVDTRTMSIGKVEGQGNKKRTIGVILTGRNSLHFNMQTINGRDMTSKRQ